MRRFLFYRAGSADEGKKLKDVIRREFSLSASLLIALKSRPDGITVNGDPATVGVMLHPGDTVRIDVGDAGADSGFSEGTPPEILYEDSDLIAVEKPPFVPVHPSAGHPDDTLANGLTAYFHTKGETFVCRCVTRLDRNTSGVVLFAKNAYAHDRMRRAMMAGNMEKEYEVLVRGKPPFSGTISAPILRGDGIVRHVDPQGKPAVTDYRLKQSDGEISLLTVFPRTGRTHQIRVHMAHLGFPVVSDFLYGDENDGILTRHGLHCSRLTFSHPVTGKTVRIVSPLPADMRSVADRLPVVERWYSLDRYLKEGFGEKLWKIPLNCSFGCPNRNGIGNCPCLFCADAASSFAPADGIAVREQLIKGKAALAEQGKTGRYIAYFQTYTNTYAPIGRLREVFSVACADPDVAAVSVATRPDCLPPEVLDLLEELSRIKPFWVELGLQTASEETARYLRIGYSRPVFEQSATELRRRGIRVIAHLIFGLPGEDRAQMIRSAEYAGRFCDGVKIQMLQILRGAALAEVYEKTPFPLLTAEEYADTVVAALAHLPEHTVIHRLTGDPPKDLLIAPAWTADKKKVRALIAAKAEEQNLIQGVEWEK